MARQEMLEFTRNLFRSRPDLSTLTQSIVRRQFLAHAGLDHLEPREKQALKRLVEDELLKMQVDEASAKKEKRDLAKKAKRPPSPCSDPGRKRRRFDSESEPSSVASSPDSIDSLAKNRMAAEISAIEEHPRMASKKIVESSDEEQQEDLTVKTGSEEKREESSEEEEEGSIRRSKVLKLESSEGEESRERKMRKVRAVRREEEEKEDESGEKEDEKEDQSSEGKEGEEGERDPRGRTRKKPGMSNKRVLGKMSARRKRARELRENSGEEEPVQKTGEKMGSRRGAESHQESEEEGEEKLVLEEDRKPRPQSNGRKQSTCGERHRRHLGSREDGEVQDSDSEADCSQEEPSTWKGKDRPQREDNGDESFESGKPARVGRLSGEESDSEAERSPKGERKDCSSKTQNSKGRTRSSSSSSSDGSPEPKGRKARSGCRGEDHPAVMRLKRYIRACGAHRNYKKLLGSCHSRKECLSVLRAELEALGMKGNPSLDKCRALKERREEEAEVASLDVSNIINCSGRPRRRTAWNPSAADPQSEIYRRALDSEEEQPRLPPPDWSHMRGIISSDGESG